MFFKWRAARRETWSHSCQRPTHYTGKLVSVRRRLSESWCQRKDRAQLSLEAFSFHPIGTCTFHNCFHQSLEALQPLQQQQVDREVSVHKTLLGQEGVRLKQTQRAPFAVVSQWGSAGEVKDRAFSDGDIKTVTLLSAHLYASADYLHVVDIHMFKEPYEINKQQHHTDKYYNPKLIVRRGQPFQIQIDFNRPYKPETDQFWLEYLIGKCLAKAVFSAK